MAGWRTLFAIVLSFGHRSAGIALLRRGGVKATIAADPESRAVAGFHGHARPRPVRMILGVLCAGGGAFATGAAHFCGES